MAKVVVVTSVGEMEISLFDKKCPQQCKNFVKLCLFHYYDGCLFFNVQKEYIIQSGDPTNKGNGGCCFDSFLASKSKSKSNPIPRFCEGRRNIGNLKHDKKGTVSMAGNKRGMIASQFFVTCSDDLEILDDRHSIIGHLTKGFDTLDKIDSVETDDNGKPFVNIRILKTLVVNDPFPSSSHELSILDTIQKALDSVGETGGERHTVDDDDALEESELLAAEPTPEELEEREARSRAGVLEMLGDLPTADIKPPENVLFVCKLNPATRDEDLELVFSRFGEIVSCEVVRDWKTDVSLQYAFVEFKEKRDAEEAYHRMDGVLIDDRRIHVDFSQSVSKLVMGPDGKTSEVSYVNHVINSARPKDFPKRASSHKRHSSPDNRHSRKRAKTSHSNHRDDHHHRRHHRHHPSGGINF